MSLTGIFLALVFHVVLPSSVSSSPQALSIKAESSSNMFERLMGAQEEEQQEQDNVNRSGPFCLFEKVDVSWSIVGATIGEGTQDEDDFDLQQVVSLTLLRERDEEKGHFAVVKQFDLGQASASAHTVRVHPEEKGDGTVLQSQDFLSCDTNGGPSCILSITSINLLPLQDQDPFTHKLQIHFNADADIELASAVIESPNSVLSTFRLFPEEMQKDFLHDIHGSGGKWARRDLFEFPVKGKRACRATPRQALPFYLRSLTLVPGSIVEAAVGGNLSLILATAPPSTPTATRYVTDVSSSLTLRVGEVGTYSLKISAVEEAANTDRSLVFKVVDCEGDGGSISTSSHVVITQTLEEAPNPPDNPLNAASPAHALPRPVYRVNSKLSLTGDRPFRIPSSAFATSSSPSFSLSFWAYLSADPPITSSGEAASSYRTLFYKGDPDAVNPQRTPSAFLTPLQPLEPRGGEEVEHETTSGESAAIVEIPSEGQQRQHQGIARVNPLLLQLSTVATDEASSPSKLGLTTATWTHLAFTLDDDDGSDDGSSKCSYKIYVNGVLDTELYFSDKVLHNDYPMMIGHAPGMPGPKMMLSSLQVYDEVLDKESIAKLWKRQLNAHELDRGAFNDSFLASGLSPRLIGSSPSMLLEATFQEMKKVQSENDCGGDVDERLGLWEDAAKMGSGKAALMAAEIYIYGTERANLLKRDAGGKLCDVLELSKRDMSKGVRYLEIASARGSGEAMYKLSLMLSSGLGVAGIDALQHAQPLSPAPLTPPSPSPSRSTPSKVMAPPLSTQTVSNARISKIALDLLHLAAGVGHVNAALNLANRYKRGFGGVKVDHEAAAHYLRVSSDAAHEYYHTPGNQPLHEYHRLRVGHEADIQKGQKGDDDEELQYTIMMAEKGDLEAMNSYAGMLYWGVRGFERDHKKALYYWDKAAERGHVGALCGAASMYLRGEGMEESNLDTAVAYYLKAREMGSSVAINGLGYAYFFGQGGMEKDQEKAFGYFSEAANLAQDSDSLTNAAHCYATGQGVEKDEFKAAELYDKAATKFGSFDAAIEMGRRFHEGNKGVQRNPEAAGNYLMSASRVGESGELLRLGFDLYMAGDFDAALKIYAEAAELGYEVGMNNAAYLLDVGAAAIEEKSKSPKDKRGGGASAVSAIAPGGGEGEGWLKRESSQQGLMNKAASLRFHRMAAEDGNAESFAAIGDSYYWGIEGEGKPDYDEAFRWYRKAAVGGSTKGAYYVGFMQEYHMNDLKAAIRQYSRVGRSINIEREGLEMVLLVKFSVWRCEIKQGRAWKLWKSLASEGGVGGGPHRLLPPLPMDRVDGDSGAQEGIEQGEDNEGGASFSEQRKTWISNLATALSKVRFMAKTLFLEHRGVVFGLNQSEDLGSDIIWSNVGIAVCVILLLLNLTKEILNCLSRMTVKAPAQEEEEAEIEFVE